MRRDRQLLNDILDSATSIGEFLPGGSREEFVGNDLVRSAILHKLTVIGEAAARVSAELKTQHPEVPWSDIVGFRNIAVHAYFSVDWGIVWTTATEEVPHLASQVRAVLAAEPE